MPNNSEVGSRFNIPDNELFKIISSSLKSAVTKAGKKGNPRIIHRNRSKYWVEFFAHQIELFYHNNLPFEEIHAFPGNWTEKRFKRREYLYDIHIGNFRTYKAKKNKKELWYMDFPIWQIESEFIPDTRGVGIDFAKLISGSAPMRMMIGPMHGEGGKDDIKIRYYMDNMKQIARYINNVNSLYFLLLPHPSNWSEDVVKNWKLFKWDDYQWINQSDKK